MPRLHTSYVDLNGRGEFSLWEDAKPLRPIPCWVNALVSLGHRVGAQQVIRNSELWTIVVPDRSYTALLVALGVTIACIGNVDREFPLSSGDEVHWITPSGLKRGIVDGPAAPADGAFVGGYRIRPVVRKRSQQGVIEIHGSSDLIRTKGHITLEHAKAAHHSSDLLSRLGVDAPSSWWVEGDPVVCVIGEQGRLLSEAAALAFGTEQLRISFSDLLMAERQNTKWHGKTRIIPARSDEVDMATIAGVLICDGPESLHVLQEVSCTDSSNAIVVLLTEWEFAKISSDLQQVRRDWGGAWLDRGVVNAVLKGADGAFALAKTRAVA